jgi:hypothetical protein
MSTAPEITTMRRWIADPVAFVRENFSVCEMTVMHDRVRCPDCVEPDEWQHDFLYSLRDNDRTGASACKGPGKTAGMGWGIQWWEACHVDAQTIAMSITKDNAKDNLWKELAFWYGRSEFMQRTFEMRAERMVSRERPGTWWVSLRAFPKQADEGEQANTLAGFHSPYPLVAMDEMGDYPHGVVAAADGIFADKHAHARIVAAWNPTDPAGPAGRACTKDRHKWNIINITGDPDDPKRSPRINEEWARQELQDRGYDDPWNMINILGQFPPSGAWQAIKTNDVMAALEREFNEHHYAYAPRILGVDPALGGTDRSVIFPRQGFQAFEPVIMRSDNPMAVVGRIVQAIQDWQPHAVFIDSIGHGAPMLKRLHELGYKQVIGCDFREKSHNRRYFNNRMMCWGEMGEWMAEASIPNIPGLANELTEPTYDYKSDGRKILCPKDDLDHSPDMGDALALTFAYPVPQPAVHDFIDPIVLASMPREQRIMLERHAEGARQGHGIADYNPFKTSR